MFKVWICKLGSTTKEEHVPVGKSGMEKQGIKMAIFQSEQEKHIIMFFVAMALFFLGVLAGKFNLGGCG